MDVGAAVVADVESFHPVEPGEGAFDDPAVSAQAGTVRCLAASDDRFDPASSEFVAVAVGVVGAVGEQRVRSAAGTAWQAGNCRYSIDERQQLGHVVAVRRGHNP